jgi:hypothetical protein
LRREVDDRNLEINMIKQKHLVEIDRVKADLHEAMQVKSQALIDK